MDGGVEGKEGMEGEPGSGSGRSEPERCACNSATSTLVALMSSNIISLSGEEKAPESTFVGGADGGAVCRGKEEEEEEHKEHEDGESAFAGIFFYWGD